MHPHLAFIVRGIFLEWYGISSSTNCSGHGLRTKQKRPRLSSINHHPRAHVNFYRIVLNFGGSYSLQNETTTAVKDAVCISFLVGDEVSPGCLLFGSDASRKSRSPRDFNGVNVLARLGAPGISVISCRRRQFYGLERRAFIACQLPPAQCALRMIQPGFTHKQELVPSFCYCILNVTPHLDKVN